MNSILPFAIASAWFSFGGVPVPSMTRTWSSTKTGASTLMKSELLLAFCVCAIVIAATSNAANRNRRRIVNLARTRAKDQRLGQDLPSQFFKKPADGFDPAVEVRDVKLLVRSVEIVI